MKEKADSTSASRHRARAFSNILMAGAEPIAQIYKDEPAVPENPAQPAAQTDAKSVA